MNESNYVPADRPGPHFEMLMSRLRCPGCDSDLTAVGAVLIGRVPPSEDEPLLPVGRTRIVPLERHPFVGMIEDTLTLNACLYDGRYACVFCRRGIEDLGTEIVWREPHELEGRLDAAVAAEIARPRLAGPLLLGLLLRRASQFRCEGHGGEDASAAEEMELAVLRELAAGLAGLLGVPPDGVAEHHGLRLRCREMWDRTPAMKAPDVLGLEVVRRLTEGHGGEGEDAAFVRLLRQHTTDELRRLCRTLWAGTPWYHCHVDGHLAEGRRVGGREDEAAYLRLLARTLWAGLPEGRGEVLASVERSLGRNSPVAYKAKVLADFHAGRGEGPYQAGVYSDGVILYLSVSPSTLELFLDEFADAIEDHAWSGDGFCCAVILRGEPEPLMDRVTDLASQLGEKLFYADVRGRDLNEIDLFVAYLAHVLGQDREEEDNRGGATADPGEA